MSPLRRKSVSKGKSASQFRSHSKHTKAANLNSPMRGGFRF
jgi:hypothetical protein